MVVLNLAKGYNEQFLPISEAIEKIEEDIDWLSDLKGILYQKK